MKIVCAAIMINDNMVISAHRHCDAYEILHNDGIAASSVKIVEGFITDEQKFVDRYEAAKIAFAANQTETLCSPLYSEDIY